MKINELKIDSYDKNDSEDVNGVKDILYNMTRAIQNHSGYIFSTKVRGDYVYYTLYKNKDESVGGMIFSDDLFQLSNKIAWNIGGVVNANIDEFLEDGENLSKFINSQAKVNKEYWGSFGVNETVTSGDVAGLPSGGFMPTTKIGIPMSDGGGTIDFRKYLQQGSRYKRINRIKKCPGVPRVRKKSIIHKKFRKNNDI